MPTPVSSEIAGTTGVDSGRAWLIVAATFISTFTGFGLIYSFGAFFDSMAREFGTGRAATAFMLALTSAIYFLLGMITGRLGDRVGPRPLLITSAVTLASGMIATSKVDSIYAGYATYGLGLGIAIACAYVPMVAFVGGWFVRRRTAAIGVAVSGIGIGTLFVAPLSQTLIERYGWRQSFVILGIGGAILMLVAAAIAKAPPLQAHEQTGRSVAQLIRDRSFISLYLSGVLIGIAILVPFVFIKNYAVGRGIDARAAALLVGLIGASSVIGRLGLGALGSRFDPVGLLKLSFIMQTLSYLLWLFAGSSYLLLVLFAITMGVGYGGFIALMPAAAASIFGAVGLGNTLGFLYTSAAVGGLIGPTLVGAVIDATSYSVGISVLIVVTGLSTICLYFIRTTSTSGNAAHA